MHLTTPGPTRHPPRSSLFLPPFCQEGKNIKTIHRQYTRINGKVYGNGKRIYADTFNRMLPRERISKIDATRIVYILPNGSARELLHITFTSSLFTFLPMAKSKNNMGHQWRINSNNITNL